MYDLHVQVQQHHHSNTHDLRCVSTSKDFSAIKGPYTFKDALTCWQVLKLPQAKVGLYHGNDREFPEGKKTRTSLSFVTENLKFFQTLLKEQYR